MTMAFFQRGITLKALLQSPDLLNPPKLIGDKAKDKKIEDGPTQFTGQSAFLGPNLWDKTVSLDSDDDLNLEYLDLDQFLKENGVPSAAILDNVNEGLINKVLQDMPQDHEAEVSKSPATSEKNGLLSSQPCSQQQQADIYHPGYNGKTMGLDVISSTSSAGHPSVHPDSSDTNSGQGDDETDFLLHPNDLALVNLPVSAMNMEGRDPSVTQLPGYADNDDIQSDINPHDLALSQTPGHEDFNPRERNFSVEELRPQPMIKKSRKIYTPEDLKDDRYWSRRRKNNVAAKRSRDARRIKENQIAMRASFLENEVSKLKRRLSTAMEENEVLCKRLAKYEPI